MKKLSLVLSLVLFVVGMTMAQRTVTGTITDTGGQPLIGASILVKGTSSGTVTDIDGSYSVSVPEGATTLIVSYTGFNTEEVEVGVSDVLDLTMEEGVELGEVVVTGLGIKREKKALGYGVTTLGAQDIGKVRSEADVGRILRGKAPGVDITQTSGIAGSGTNVIIRGYSSITGTNQPLFVIDGVPFNTDTNSDRGFVGGGATASSRFLDLDPNNIQEVSILKGLSATVLYGEAGRNGVVLITTKSGDAAGASDDGFEVSVSQTVSATSIANLPDYQDTYGNGFSGDFGWFFSNWGPSFDIRGSNGIDENGQIAHPYDQAQYNDDFPEFKGVRYDYKAYESVENFFDTGIGSITSVNVDKNLGTNGSMSATYSFTNDQGFTPDDDQGNSTNFLEKHNFGLGGRANLDNGFIVKGSFNYVDSRRLSPPAASGAGSNPSGASLFANLIYTPRSIDLMNLPYESPLDGSQVYYRRGGAIQNPLWTLNNARDEETVRRFYGRLEVERELFDFLSFTYRLGIDQYAQSNRREVNKGGSQIPNGEMFSSTRLNRITDQVLNLIYNFELGEAFTLDGIVGANLRKEVGEGYFSQSTNQFVFDLFQHDNFTVHNIFSGEGEEINNGVYATATLGYQNYLYLNVQARNDWTSTLEKDNRSVFYPSASLSFVPTDAFQGLQNSNVLNFLKLRVGYGTSAGYPDPYATRTVLGTDTREFITQGGTTLNTNTVSNILGNPNLTRELHTEIEVGVEARFLSNRIGIDLSLYDKKSTDLIIELPLDPATGFLETTVNAAEVTNRGIELGLNIVPFNGEFNWDAQINFTSNDNVVDAIIDGVDQVNISGSFNDVANWAIPGESYGVIRGTPYRRINGQILVGADGIPVPANSPEIIGDPVPNYTVNWINNFTFKGINLGFQFDYTDGGSIYSLTTATMLARGVTVDTDVNRFLPLIYPGVKDEAGTPNDIQTYIGDLAFRSYFFANEGGIFDGTLIRLREVWLAYSLPEKWLAKTPFGSAGLRISGQNLWFNAPNFPEGVNYDPEVVSTGVGNGRALEFITGPTAQRWGATLDFTF